MALDTILVIDFLTGCLLALLATLAFWLTSERKRRGPPSAPGEPAT
jgi:hypothetical protein